MRKTGPCALDVAGVQLTAHRRALLGQRPAAEHGPGGETGGQRLQEPVPAGQAFDHHTTGHDGADQHGRVGHAGGLGVVVESLLDRRGGGAECRYRVKSAWITEHRVRGHAQQQPQRATRAHGILPSSS
ncbi:hypothetical protein BBK82_08915 [Lentzea guizhouensis]|uniref:Uncharacterized protein n=1 Tax=Lentzea guizhouensis TaxID=1586287 RepID=A0A1B2HEM0_9PSEU|nr:hypothetical protein BBK82_08915 [Lentzea guizhouensis]